MMNQIEDFMNKLTDMDWGWWPVLSLRPAKNQYIDNILLIQLTLVFGTLIGLEILILGLFILMIIIGEPPLIIIREIPFLIPLFGILLGWVIFFLGYKFTFAYFWNRRARRLRNEKI